MHVSGLQTVVVTIEELTIKVRLLKLSLEEQVCFSSCSLFFFVVCFVFFKNYVLLWKTSTFPISLVPEIGIYPF